MIEFKFMDYVVRAEARRELLDTDYNEETTLYFLNTLANLLRTESRRVKATDLALLADWFVEQANALHDICEAHGLYCDLYDDEVKRND